MNYLFTITIISSALWSISLIFTLMFPKYRIWPPPSKNSWQYWFTWILTIISVVGVILISIINRNTFIYNHWSHYIIGSLLILGGVIFALWGVRTLTLHMSSGLKNTLITNGPYKYTRNPQYVGDISVLLGIIIISNSLMVIIPVALSILWFILAPFTEEPWLRQQYGTAYDEFCSKIPRFF